MHVATAADKGQNFRSGPEPEYNNEIEIGFKSEMFDRRVRFNVSTYRDLIESSQRQVIQPSITPGVSNTIIQNAGKVENRGWKRNCWSGRSTG